MAAPDSLAVLCGENTCTTLRAAMNVVTQNDVTNATAKTSFRYAIFRVQYDRLHASSRVSPTNTAGSRD